jgi:PAS domain-containing protein
MEIPHGLESAKVASAAEDRLQLLIATVPTFVWRVLPDGSVDFINQRSLECHGHSLEAARGWGWTAAIHPDDLASLLTNGAPLW